MVRLFQALAAATALLLATPAAAAGTASPAPPKAPEVDFASLPDGATATPPPPGDDPHPVVARLLLEQDALVPGQKARIGVHLIQQEGWHTYWSSPGDIGQPTDIVWTAPEGVEIPPQTYTIPQRFEHEEIVSFGYDAQVLHISEFDVPADLAPGSHEIKAQVNWLVCLTSCIPGSVELTLPVEVKDAAADQPWTPLFAHYSQQHPTPALEVTGFGWDFAASQSALRPNDTFKAAFKITGRDGKKLAKHPDDKVPWPTFTPFVPFDWAWAPDKVSVTNTDDGGLLVTLEATAYEPDPLPELATIGGLFQVKVGDEWVRTEIAASIPWQKVDTDIQQLESPLLSGGDGAASADGTDAGAGGDGPGAEGAATGGSDVGAAGLLYNLAFAFVGGLILNIMPCVLPVLTLKLYSLVEQTDITPREQRVAGAAYTAGILASFWALAGVIVGMRLMMGVQVDWGFQFQYPPYVAALAAIVFAFGLSLFGVFEIPAFGADSATEHASKEGMAGYFFTGVFATLLATPCSAPFLGTAAAFAFGAPTPVLFAIFSMVGLGLAFPFLVIAFVPAAYALLPRPGGWMEGFKQLLGFSLIATTIWLVSVLLGQIGPARTVAFMFFLTVLAMGCWIYGRWGGVAASGTDQLKALAAAGVLTVAGGIYFIDLEYADVENCDDGSIAELTDDAWEEHIPWQNFSNQRVEALAGTPVFVDFTADWCLTCKVNEKTILETHAVKTVMKERGIVPLKADWTRPDPEITEWLHRFGRAGVPFYLLIPAEGDPIALPEVITPDMVISAMERAAPDDV